MDELRSIAWSHDAQSIASASADSTIRIWNSKHLGLEQVLEGHTESVKSTAFSFDDALLASKSDDDTVHIWRTDSWEPLAQIPETTCEHDGGLAFHPSLPRLVTLGENDTVIRIWELSFAGLVGAPAPTGVVRYTSAKVVLVGESNVGKSCLAMRLAEGRYPEDHEQGTTHGMRFWPMEAEDLHPAARPPEGQRRDVVLWDFGGQDEYKLVHQMFLHDTTRALVLIDPTRGRAALDEARDWNKRLEKHFGPRQAVKLLVGAKQDRASELVNRPAIDAMCSECGFAAYVEASAKNGRNVDGLREVVAEILDWDALAKTSRPELFQQIRDEIEERRKAGEVVLELTQLKHVIQETRTENHDEAAVSTVTDQLSTQGIISQATMPSGESALILQVPLINQYAGSLIVAARNNPRGVPALEEQLIGSPDVPLPGVETRLPRTDERLVLRCVTELLIECGICFRHEGLLIFPTQLKPTEFSGERELSGSVQLYYDFSGAIDNVYASLIAWLVLGREFGRIRLWENRVDFEVGNQGTCGIRRVSKGAGFAHIDVYFDDETPTDLRTEC